MGFLWSILEVQWWAICQHRCSFYSGLCHYNVKCRSA